MLHVASTVVSIITFALILGSGTWAVVHECFIRPELEAEKVYQTIRGPHRARRR